MPKHQALTYVKLHRVSYILGPESFQSVVGHSIELLDYCFRAFVRSFVYLFRFVLRCCGAFSPADVVISFRQFRSARHFTRSERDRRHFQTLSCCCCC